VGRVVSADGTRIDYERQGDGPPVVLVGGGLDDGSENAPLAGALAAHCTVVNYSRRGRGHSGDTVPYALEREIEDLDALLALVGGEAGLYGVSSGGALALEAAAARATVTAVAVYEVPYQVDADQVRIWEEYVGRLRVALAGDDRDVALELFMRLAGSGDAEIAAARESPAWPRLRELAPTLAYDAAALGDGPVPRARLASLTQPVLVLTGSVGGGLPGFFDAAADALVAALPRAERRVVPGQGHVAAPAAVVPLLAGFFAG
jgi:pimeloyl-ACP methyl ester carboxylesterase